MFVQAVLPSCRIVRHPDEVPPPEVNRKLTLLTLRHHHNVNDHDDDNVNDAPVLAPSPPHAGVSW
jgi:hypothetical protein